MAKQRQQPIPTQPVMIIRDAKTSEILLNYNAPGLQPPAVNEQFVIAKDGVQVYRAVKVIHTCRSARYISETIEVLAVLCPKTEPESLFVYKERKR